MLLVICPSCKKHIIEKCVDKLECLNCLDTFSLCDAETIYYSREQLLEVTQFEEEMKIDACKGLSGEGLKQCHAELENTYGTLFKQKRKDMLKKQLDELIPRYKKAEEFFSDETIPQEKKDKSVGLMTDITRRLGKLTSELELSEDEIKKIME